MRVIWLNCGNWQPGLAGINLGKFLIKRVIDLVKKDMPRIYVSFFVLINSNYTFEELHLFFIKSSL